MDPQMRYDSLTWPEAGEVGRQGLIALLPVGSTEAHGPHLPLSTDVILAEGMAQGAASLLRAEGHTAWCLPSIAYGVTDCAADFSGTLTIGAATLASLLEDITASLEQQGARLLCLVNAHLEPAHRKVLRGLTEREGSLPVVFPDKVRRQYVPRLGEEFQSGACHAGDYETSLVQALRPELVREDLRKELPDHPVSLGQALHEGKKTFREAGGDQAYFGWPARATPETGRRLITELADIVAGEVRAVLAAGSGQDGEGQRP